MVVGSGLLGKSFVKYTHVENVLIFCSGVSNSGSRNHSDFERERELLLSYKEFDGCLVYFSTCSIYDPSLDNSMYILHKKNMENLIREHFRYFLILRLPNLVGPSDNPNTLTNFVYNKIQSGEQFSIHTSASRYLLDVDDVVSAVDFVLEKGIAIRSNLDLVLAEKILIQDLVKEFELFMGKKGRTELISRGADYVVHPSQVFTEWQGKSLIDARIYLRKLLAKYYV